MGFSKFFESVGASMTSAITNMKFKKGAASEFKNLPNHFYDLTANPLTSPTSPITMSDFKGKVVLVVNIASMCGYTANNNKFLSALAEKHKSKDDFVILAFPCGQFANQEHSDTAKICSVHQDGLKDCKECIGKNLLLMEKCDVNGDAAHPLFKFLRLNSLLDGKSGKVGNIPWNYCKFLIDREGSVSQFFKSGDYSEVETAIDALLE